MIRIGVICPSDIAFRRFMPALSLCKEIQYIGLAVCSIEERFGESANEILETQKQNVIDAEYQKAKKFVDNFGGKIYV